MLFSCILELNVVELNIYVAPANDDANQWQSLALSAMVIAYLMLNIVKSCNITLVSKTIHHRLEKSPVVGPDARME